MNSYEDELTRKFISRVTALYDQYMLARFGLETSTSMINEKEYQTIRKDGVPLNEEEIECLLIFNEGCNAGIKLTSEFMSENLTEQGEED